MPPLTLVDFTTNDEDYVQKMNNNNTSIEDAVNTLQSQVLASSGEGAELILDVFDRDGLVGSHSYVLDLDNYAGASQITIGRRPVAVPALLETDVSVAWITVSGSKSRVRLVGDLVLDALSITTGLPKTIYVGIPANGTPQLFEDTVAPNILYAYSMTWNGFNLTNFKRRVHLLPAYTTIQAIAGASRFNDVFDTETDWLSDSGGKAEIVFPGAADDNGIGVDGAVEILGFYATAGRSDADGFFAPGSGTPTQNQVKFKVINQGFDWAEFDFDASSAPNTIFKAVDVGAVGDSRFVIDVQRFQLERTGIGPFVVSARAFRWGAIYRQIVGIPIPKDNGTVVLI